MYIMMKMYSIFAVFTAILCSSCSQEEQLVAVEKCHTEIVPTPLQSAVVADMARVRTGQSLSAVVKDHAKKVVGYSKEMFLADNPHIARRKPVTKLDPCDSTKVKYTVIPVFSGDTVYLRHPFQIDTVIGNQESVNWTPGRYGSRIQNVIDMVDDGNRFTISMQDIACKPVLTLINPIKAGDEFNFPTMPAGWAWLIAFAIIAGAIIVRNGIIKGSFERNNLLEQVINQGGMRGGGNTP